MALTVWEVIERLQVMESVFSFVLVVIIPLQSTMSSSGGQYRHLSGGQCGRFVRVHMCEEEPDESGKE